VSNAAYFWEHVCDHSLRQALVDDLDTTRTDLALVYLTKMLRSGCNEDNSDLVAFTSERPSALTPAALITSMISINTLLTAWDQESDAIADALQQLASSQVGNVLFTWPRGKKLKLHADNVRQAKASRCRLIIRVLCICIVISYMYLLVSLVTLVVWNTLSYFHVRLSHVYEVYSHRSYSMQRHQF
jgi:hypothetical protein